MIGGNQNEPLDNNHRLPIYIGSDNFSRWPSRLKAFASQIALLSQYSNCDTNYLVVARAAFPRRSFVVLESWASKLKYKSTISTLNFPSILGGMGGFGGNAGGVLIFNPLPETAGRSEMINKPRAGRRFGKVFPCRLSSATDFFMSAVTAKQ